MSPDDGEDQNTVNPQSWNLYSYGRNNPLIGTDADGHTYNVCSADGKSCGNVSDKDFEAEQKQDQSNGVIFAHGTITDSSGAVQGTFTHDPDIAGDPGANIAAMGKAGNQGIGAINWFGKQMLYNALGEGLFQGAGIAMDMFAAGRAASDIAFLRDGGKVIQEMAEEGKKGAEIIQKSGGESAAIRDYQTIHGDEHIDGTIRIKTLSDGTTVSLRQSSGGQPTISIQHADYGVTKIRY